MLKVALAQINPCVGDIKYNADKIISNIRKAKETGASIVIFPELSLTGYPPEDLLLKPHFIDENLRYIKIIEKESKGIIALMGFVDRLGDKIYNACAFLENGKLKDVYRKIYLPNYGVFDEERYFTPGGVLSFYKFDGYRFCVSICEDIWREGFIKNLASKKLDFIVNISASPFHLGKISIREKIVSNLAKATKANVFYCDLVGGQDELVFDGTSMVVSPNGDIIAHAERFKEDFLIFELDGKRKYPAKRIIAPQEEEAFSALKLGLYDYVRKNGFKKVIIGISGGIDSAVVAALAERALGKENVYGLIMPSRYTSNETFLDAKTICENLGIGYKVISIDKMLDTYLEVLRPLFKTTKGTKTEENLQARIRGNLLMAYSNEFGYLVLNTGNKSEVSCGYCTLYGDMIGGFGLLKDIPKMLVYKIARHVNSTYANPVIPVSVMRRAPSAELKPNQKDTDSLPPYSVLDPIIKLYVEDDFSLEKIVKKGFNRTLVRRVIAMIDSSEYKRRQGPVGIKITPRAFGRDRRMPITNKFNY